MSVYYCLYFVFFLFKQKTAYDMRISDWSSDVCSSDLGVFRRLLVDQRAAKRRPAIALGRYAGKRVFHVAERLQHRRAIRLIGLFTILAPDTHVGLALPPIEQREADRARARRLDAVAFEQRGQRGQIGRATV